MPQKFRANEAQTAFSSGREKPRHKYWDNCHHAIHVVRSATFFKMIWNRNCSWSSTNRNAERLSRLSFQIRQIKAAKPKGNGHESSTLAVLWVNPEGNTPARSHHLALQKLTHRKETTCSGQLLLGSVISPPPTIPLEWNNGMTGFPPEDSSFKK